MGAIICYIQKIFGILSYFSNILVTLYVTIINVYYFDQNTHLHLYFMPENFIKKAPSIFTSSNSKINQYSHVYYNHKST